MRIITLLTDFGLKDNFVGVIKGVILKIKPDVGIVDISHNIDAQDKFAAAFLLKASYKYFPEGTIHVIVVDPGVGAQRKIILVKTKEYYFLSPDNGILSLALKEEKIERIVSVENDKFFLKPVSDTFHGRDIFAPVAGFLSKGNKLSEFGPQVKHIEEISVPQPQKNNQKLTGQIIHIDRFGNLVTNIDIDTLQSFSKGVKIRIKGMPVDGISASYQDVGFGKPLAIIGSFGYLEIAVNGASAENYFSLRKSDKIELEEPPEEGSRKS